VNDLLGIIGVILLLAFTLAFATAPIWGAVLLFKWAVC
jgi:hypothetical protein